MFVVGAGGKRPSTTEVTSISEVFARENLASALGNGSALVAVSGVPGRLRVTER
jgi:hypothetical protein